MEEYYINSKLKNFKVVDEWGNVWSEISKHNRCSDSLKSDNKSQISTPKDVVFSGEYWDLISDI